VGALPVSSRRERIDLPDIAATEALAHRIAAAAKRGDVIALSGLLGAGKTTFARAFITEIARLSGESAGEVPSPTFTLVQTYAFAHAAVWHFDLYRLAAPGEAWELGLEDALADGISLIEWPERLGPLLPRKRLDVLLTQGPTPDARIAEIVAYE
jgi:tRNA threonylcarbamoyladenosine biosynthesis protein TsaE